MQARPPSLIELPYHADSAALFEPFADEHWAVFLDSAHPAGGGRWDILAARPYATLVGDDRYGAERGRRPAPEATGDPFAQLRLALAPRGARSPLPFAGGAIGYFAYDLARRFMRLPGAHKPPCGWPDLAVGLYDWAVLVDHHERRSWFVHAGRRPMDPEQRQTLIDRFSRPTPARRRAPFSRRGPLAADFTPQAYRLAFDRVQAYIRAGDCYQVNLAQRFGCPVAGDPWLAYQVLRRLSPAPHSAYLRLPWGAVLSVSPERFLQVRAGEVETRPIKGTRARSPQPAQDARLRQELRASAKDQAENLMIVDLLRNDLGRVCATGSVRVPQLFQVESYAQVHHLVSTVTGRLRPDEDALSLLRAAFPGGSVTGAPKLRAMQIIDELEPQRRGVYCGAIGYIGFDGDMDTSIAIRTLTWQDDRLVFWAGGGLVADSDPEAEYQECLDKAAAVFRLLDACR
ncbi:MAG: aminodeoxychorismate synthase component I, partial [Thiobacillaceae bacterium]|nr:aminodeoxychorismate synthase component I [Thiobacillaceae bacterium]